MTSLGITCPILVLSSIDLIYMKIKHTENGAFNQSCFYALSDMNAKGDKNKHLIELN